MILVDCSRAFKGGSAQHVFSFMLNIRIDNKQHLFTFILSQRIKSRLISELNYVHDFNIIWINSNILLSSIYLTLIQFKYTGIFILGGPQYWFPCKPSVVTYAIPHYLYPISEYWSFLRSASTIFSYFRFIRLNILRFLHLFLFSLNDKIVV